MPSLRTTRADRSAPGRAARRPAHRGAALPARPSGVGLLDRPAPTVAAPKPASLPAPGRPLPPGFEGKRAPGGLARTGEETAIDLFGEGSELRAAVTSPVRTVGNAFGGLFSPFPSRARWRQQAVVQTAINNAWAASLGDYYERCGWILWDRNSGNYSVLPTTVGDQYACQPTPRPPDPAAAAANQVYQVGHWHIHPPLDPGIPAMTTPANWPIGPSPQDENFAQANNSPGIVRDYTTVLRDRGTTDYTYGPWCRS